MTDGQGFADASLPRHLARGLVGFGAVAGAFALIPVVGLGALVLLPMGLLALRGCPMCWTLGLIELISAGKLKRTCINGRCELSSATRNT